MAKTTNEREAGALLAAFPAHDYATWRKAAEETLKGVPFEKRLVSRTWEGIDLQPIHQAKDAQDLPHMGSLPGFAPFVRGIHPAGHRGMPWWICQEFAAGTPKEFNATARHGIARGQTALNLVLDVATRLGLDPDQAKPGDVAACGVSLFSARDLTTALDGIDLAKTPIFIQAGVSTLPILAMLVAHLRKKNLFPRVLRGGFEMDPLGELARDGSLPVSLETAWRDMALLTRWAAKESPCFQTLSVQTRVWHEAGAHAAQELAFALATGTQYLREMQARGLDANDVAPRLRFSMSVGSQFFMELAKFRAARLLWAQVVRAFGGNDEAQKLAIHARTSLWNKTVQDPYVNMLRATTEACSGLLGGCDSLHVGAFDEPIRPPDEFSERVARNTQILLLGECHFDQVTDPAGGSWFVESLTDGLARKAWELFQEIEKQGGMAKAILAGWPQAQVEATAKARLDAVSKRRDTIVGTNQYANPAEKPLTSTLPDYAALQRTRAKQAVDYRASSDHQIETTALDRLVKILDAGPGEVVEAAIAALERGATLGEISRALRTNDGAKPSAPAIRARRAAEPFERLRAAAESFRKDHDHLPRVFLANMGPPAQHKLRADFAGSFFAAGGFEVVTNRGFPSAADAAKAAAASGAGTVVICSTDETYPELVPALATALKQANPKVVVVLAGLPQEHLETFRKAGVDEFIHLRADCAATLAALQHRLGLSS